MGSVSMIPFGLLAGFVDEKEVRITELSLEGFSFRTRDLIRRPGSIHIAFYNFSRGAYQNVEVLKWRLGEEKKEKYYYIYQIEIFQKEYEQAVNRLFREYTGYIRARMEGSDAEMAKEVCGYPAELDEIHQESMEEQKAIWFQKAKVQPVAADLEFALELDRSKWYEWYLKEPIAVFMENYWSKNGIFCEKKNLRIPDRLYIGNQFCHFLFPEGNLLFALMEKAYAEQRSITIAFPCLQDRQVQSCAQLLKKVDSWSRDKKTEVEILVNDWGLAGMVKETGTHLIPCMGILLNRQKKDPRLKYKKGTTRGLGENNLQASFYREYLYRTFGLERYEWESCGYPQEFPEGKNSLHLPYYQTNTSQYCPLYASCTQGERGRQSLPVECPCYCETYAYLYPEHLYMAGRYNSLFGLDTELIRHPEQLSGYKKAGIDRLVVGL